MSGDYCDVCGAKIVTAGPVAESKTCPFCQQACPEPALFCEACGYDFITGSTPRDEGTAAVPSASAPRDDAWATVSEAAASAQADSAVPSQAQEEVRPVAEVGASAAGVGTAIPGAKSWVAEVWIDPEWYAVQDSPDVLPSPGLPRIVPLRTTPASIGRPSASRKIDPVINCEPDAGVSRRHAELTTDGSRWWVEDLGSSNGTFVGQTGAPLPLETIEARVELPEDARIFLGSWTRLVVREAFPDEIA